MHAFVREGLCVGGWACIHEYFQEGGCAFVREGMSVCMVGVNDGGCAGEHVGSMRWCGSAGGQACICVGVNKAEHGYVPTGFPCCYFLIYSMTFT